MAYDSFGDRTQSNFQTTACSSSNPATATYSAANRVIWTTVNSASNGSNYDASDNMTNDGIHAYAYDAEGNLIEEATVGGTAVGIYVYDALNRRVSAQTSSGTNEYVYDYAGRRTSTWLNPSSGNVGTGTEGRIYWDGRQFAYRAWDGTTYFEHQDVLGTERMRTNYQGTVEASFFSLPWGDESNQTVGGSGPDLDNYSFAGLELDINTFHAQFRNYSMALGRWWSPDPYSGSYDLTNPQSLNRYAYVLNNPLSFIDPSGLDPVCTTDPQTGLLECTSYYNGGGNQCDQNPLECYGGGSGGNGLCMWFGYCPGTQNNTGGGSAPPKPAPSSAPTVAGPSSSVCTAAGAVAGASAGALIGGGIGEGAGALVGGGVGTLFAPGVGTVGGAILGGGGGATAGATVGATIGGVLGGIVGNVLCSKGGPRNILPSWAEGQRPNPGESASQFAKRLCDARYGPGNYPTGPGSEYNLILKWARYKFGI